MLLTDVRVERGERGNIMWLIDMFKTVLTGKTWEQRQAEKIESLKAKRKLEENRAELRKQELEERTAITKARAVGKPAASAKKRDLSKVGKTFVNMSNSITKTLSDDDEPVRKGKKKARSSSPFDI